MHKTADNISEGLTKMISSNRIRRKATIHLRRLRRRAAEGNLKKRRLIMLYEIIKDFQNEILQAIEN